MNFLKIIRQPDDVKVQTEDTPIRFEESDTLCPKDPRVTIEEENNVLRITLLPSDEAVKVIRIRFNGEIPRERDRNISILGDALGCCSAEDLVWRTFQPHRMYAWYLHLFDGERLDSYGVRTGAGSIAFWQCDPKGLTLWLDVRSGYHGVRLREPLCCAEVVCRQGGASEEPYEAARAFCRQMCPCPNLPKSPIYGLNDWYWAYGDVDEATILREAAFLGSLTRDFPGEPYMVIDDGWEVAYSIDRKGITGDYNGGPWHTCNERFSAMDEVAAKLRESGCKPGIWIRPLLTLSRVPEEALYRNPAKIFGQTLDISHPYTLEKVHIDIARLSGWGYQLIKHDFTNYDLFGTSCPASIGELTLSPLYDGTRTTAQHLRRLYETIQDAAGDAVVLGCNVTGHLSAGIHQAQRVGCDTSGRVYEWTRRSGVHSMMRLPQNHTLFALDPDSAPFTAKVSRERSFDYLEAAAVTGSVTIASVTPGLLNGAETERLRRIFRTAAEIQEKDFAVPTDWTRTAEPSQYRSAGKKLSYDWYGVYQGVRGVVSWME